MAFNWPTFRTRALTAIVFVIVMLGGLLWNHWSFALLFTIIHFGCWWEYLRLLERIHRVTFDPFTKQGFMLLGFGLMLLFFGPDYSVNDYPVGGNFSLPISLAGFVLLVTGIFRQRNVHVNSFAAAALGFLYISVSWGLMIHLYQMPVNFQLQDTVFLIKGYLIPVTIIASIWVNDTMAYIVGSFIGRTPLSPISPKKTWEGTVGGIILSVLVMSFLFPLIIGGESGLLDLMTIGPVALIASITGTFGDLLESKLKRMAGVKDSGHIMPGHGGFLDRFDSLLIAIPFCWLYIYLTIVLLSSFQ